MDDILQNLITGVPNLAVALLVLFWQQRRIDSLEKQLQTLNDRLSDDDLEPKG